MSGKRVMIVFEESEPDEKGGINFKVYLEGIDRKWADSMNPEEQLKHLSTAEFWALRCFQIGVAPLLSKFAQGRAVSK